MLEVFIQLSKSEYSTETFVEYHGTTKSSVGKKLVNTGGVISAENPTFVESNIRNNEAINSLNLLIILQFCLKNISPFFCISYENYMKNF
jgi:hypothetical protein